MRTRAMGIIEEAQKPRSSGAEEHMPRDPQRTRSRNGMRRYRCICDVTMNVPAGALGNASSVAAAVDEHHRPRTPR